MLPGLRRRCFRRLLPNVDRRAAEPQQPVSHLCESGRLHLLGERRRVRKTEHRRRQIRVRRSVPREDLPDERRDRAKIPAEQAGEEAFGRQRRDLQDNHAPARTRHASHLRQREF